MSLGLLARQPLAWDSDAAAYILAVESADGQSLEPAVARAINVFVIDCKIRGIWDAIKSCCLLCGARTLNGALKPLKGIAPTNNNFVGVDYNRETGFRGNGSNKFINTNFSSSSPLVGANNFHFSFCISSLNGGVTSVSGAKSYMADGGLNMYRALNARNATQFNINSSFGSSTGDVLMANTSGFCGLNRSNSSVQRIRIGSRNIDYSINSVGSNVDTMRLFGRNGNGVMGDFSDGRISFYSVGASIDLRLLDECISKFNNTLFRFFYPASLHPEASNWISLAEANNRPKINATTANALNVFCIAIDSANLRSKFYRLNLFCGPSLTTCIIPLYRGVSFSGTKHGNTIDQSFNFSNAAHYSELGLQSVSASITYLDTGLLTTTINSLYPNIHFSVYGNTTPTTGSFISLGDGGTSYRLLSEFGGSFLNLIGGTFQTAPLYGNPLGMTTVSREATNLARLYRNGTYVTQTTGAINSPPSASGTLWSTQTLRLFASAIQNNGPDGTSNLRSCGYSVGSALTQTEALDYYNIMQAFQTSLGRQV